MWIYIIHFILDCISYINCKKIAAMQKAVHVAFAYMVGVNKIGAIPASLLASRALSLSAASRGGRPKPLAQLLRWPVRGLLIFLRSVPEIVWALLFVRAVGLGPTAGVLAIAITYARTLKRGAKPSRDAAKQGMRS